MNLNLKGYNLTQKSWWKLLKLIPLLLLVTGLTITFFIHQLAINSERQTLKESFEIKSNKITQRIEERLKGYRLVLQGAGGLFSASNTVTRDEFHDYVESLGLSNNYSGVQSIGFSKAVPSREITSHIELVRKDGFANYHLFPLEKRDFYSPYLYLEPFTKTNLIALGFDAYSEITRRTAMEESEGFKPSDYHG